MKKLKEGLLIFLNGDNYDGISHKISDSLEYNGYKKPYLYLAKNWESHTYINHIINNCILKGEIVLVCQSEPKLWELIINKNKLNVKDRNVFCIAWASTKDDLRESSYNLKYSKFNVISEDENYITNAIIDYIESNILPENIEQIAYYRYDK